MSDISEELRDSVARRARNRCEYCHIPSKGQITWFPIDHILPKSEGGPTEESNLALSCPRCNASKWAFVDGVDPITGDSVPLFNPRSHSWTEHFEWSPTVPLFLEGRTPIGRATIVRLKMNDADPLKIRRLLLELGVLNLESDE